MPPTRAAPNLCLQHVTIWWTKASRGMPGAQVRAQLPHAYALTVAEVQAFGSGGIQLVTLREEEGFTPHAEVRPLPKTQRIHIGAVTIQPNASGIQLHYRYTGMIGAPDRSHRPPIEFDIANGRRARISYNGRFSGHGIEWLYKLTVITIAVGIPPSTDLFTVAPDHIIADLADLF